MFEKVKDSQIWARLKCLRLNSSQAVCIMYNINLPFHLEWLYVLTYTYVKYMGTQKK